MFASPLSSKKRNIYENHQQESDYKQPVETQDLDGPTPDYPLDYYKQNHLLSTPMQQPSPLLTNSNFKASPQQRDISSINFQQFRLSSTSSSKAVADNRRTEVFQNMATPLKSNILFQTQTVSPVLFPVAVTAAAAAAPSYEKPPLAKNNQAKRALPNTSHKKQIFNPILSAPVQFYSDQKNPAQNPPKFSKRLFQDSSDDEDNYDGDEPREPKQTIPEILNQQHYQSQQLQQQNPNQNNLFAQFQESSSPIQKPFKDPHNMQPPTVPKKMLSPLFSLLQDSTSTAKRQATQQYNSQPKSLFQAESPNFQQYSQPIQSPLPEVNEFSVSPEKPIGQLTAPQQPSFSSLHFIEPDQCTPQNKLFPTNLIKGKSTNPNFYESSLTHNDNPFQFGNMDNEEDQDWDLDLNRRNSEVFLDEKTFNRRKEQSIDLGENEFTRGMPGIRQMRSERIGSIVPKPRAQTLLLQIPETHSTKKPTLTLQSLANNLITPQFEAVEEDLDFQILHTRKKIIESQDFQILLKKASSQFLARISPSKQSETESVASYNHPDRFLNDFTSIQTIKSSPHSTVYKAINVPSDRQESNRIVKEIQSLAKFSSYGFGLLKFYNVWIEEGRLFLVMEHCLENLKSFRLKNPKPSESLIRQIIRDVCESLAFLHEKDCAHLGIKPENILLSKKMKFKLADLGLSKLQHQDDNNNKLSQLESHYPYIAPELVGNSQKTTSGNPTKADVFSLGAILYELMTDQDLPKYGPEWENLRVGRLGKFTNSVRYSASLKNVVKQMLLRNPQLRPSASDILKLCPPDDVHELELKYQIEENQALAKKLEELQKKTGQDKDHQNKQGLKRKVSI